MAGEEGVPYRADTSGAGATSPDLRAPLGEPYIIRPEDWINLQKAGDQNAAFTRAFQGTSSLVDNLFNQRLEREKAQADINQTVAKTGQIGVATDNLRTESDQNAQMFPLTLKAKNLELQKSQIGLDAAKATQDTNQAAIDQMGTAFKNFPDPNDVAGYEKARNQWVTDNAVAMTNPATAQQMQGQLALRDSIYKTHSRYAQLTDARTELQGLQKNGRIPQSFDIDQSLADGSYPQQLVQGRILDKLATVTKLYNQTSDQATQAALQPIMADLNYHAKMSPGPDQPAGRGGLAWGAMQVQGGQSHSLDTNGNWNDTTQPIIDAAQNRIKLEGEAAEATAKEKQKEPTVDVEYRFGPIGKDKLPVNTGKLTGIPLSQAQPYLDQPGTTITPSAQQQAVPTTAAQPGGRPTPIAPAGGGTQLSQLPTTLSPQTQGQIDDIKRRIDLPENDPQHLTPEQGLDLFRQRFPAPAPSTSRVPPNYRGMPTSETAPPATGTQLAGGPAAAPFQPDTSGPRRLNARFNNPGGLGLSDLGRAYGATESGHYDTGHPFAAFPTPEAGAAAQFALWQNKEHYLNHTLKDAITNWIGPGEHGEAEYISQRTGIPLNQVITDDFLRSPHGIRLAQAQAEYEGQNVLTVDQWQRAQDWAYNRGAHSNLLAGR
jgi:hypothetical protein